jgi:hypothetical protein
LSQFGELVREGITEEGFVISSRELIGKAKHVVSFAFVRHSTTLGGRLLVDVRKLVANVITTFIPAIVARLSTDTDAHAIII